MTFFVLLLLFVAERAHQWQSLASRDWSVRIQGKEISRRLVVWTALAIGWGEGLAFFITSERTFWVFIFLVYLAHVAITLALLMWRQRPLIRFFGLLVGVASALFVWGLDSLFFADGLSGWFGNAFDFESAVHDAELRVEVVAAAILVVHAIPCFVVNLARAARGTRVRLAAVGVGLALVEWLVVAKFVWFPERSGFPDLVDWRNFGDQADFLLHPLWMAPFLAHVAIDAIRYFQPARASTP